MTPSMLLAYASITYRMQCVKWAKDYKISTAEFRQLVERAGMSVDRLRSYVQVIEDAILAEEPAPDFYMNILAKEFDYSLTMAAPDVHSWWPVGLNHGLDDIHKKFIPKDV